MRNCASEVWSFGPSRNDNGWLRRSHPSPPSYPAHAVSRTPWLIRSMTNASGILDRPVGPDDDSRGGGAVPAIAHMRGAREFASLFRPSVKQRARPRAPARQASRMATTALVPKISKTTPCKVAWRSLACAIPPRHLTRRANHLQYHIIAQSVRRKRTSHPRRSSPSGARNQGRQRGCSGEAAPGRPCLERGPGLAPRPALPRQARHPFGWRLSGAVRRRPLRKHESGLYIKAPDCRRELFAPGAGRR